MKKMMITAAVVCLGCGMAGGAWAAGDMQAGTAETVTQADFQRGEIHPATRLVGKSVQGTEGTRLGEIKEIMIDAGRGQIAYLVVAPDASLGIGDQGRMVPWSALHTEEGTGALVADIDAAKFKEAPTEVADRQEAKQLHQFYGVAPYWQIPESRLEKEPEMEQTEELIPSPTPLWWE